MPSKLNAYRLSAVILAALLQCAPGAPVQDVPTDGPAGDPSGEELERSPDLLSASRIWDLVLDVIKNHQNAIENELHNTVEFHILQNYKVPSLPEKCPSTNFSKEACLHRLVQGLLKYRVLLKHVEKEYPGSSIPSDAERIRMHLDSLIGLIKLNMKDPERVTVLTSSQEAQLLREVDSPNNAFQGKMTALSILQNLYVFIIDCKRVIAKKEMDRRSMTNVDMAPVTFYSQI